MRAGARRLLARARTRHSVGVDALLPSLRRSVQKYLLRDQPSSSRRDIDSFLDRLNATDICLVIACQQGDDAAWNDFIAEHSSTVLSAARSFSRNESEARELAQTIWAELYGFEAGPSRSAKLLYYSGYGALGGWLRAVVSRLAIDHFRKNSRLSQFAEFSQLGDSRDPGTDGSGRLMARGLDPEQNMRSNQAAECLHKSLERAIGNLESEDRLLLKLYYHDGLRLSDAGKVLGVHEATASRRLARVHATLRRDVETILMGDFGWTKSEVAGAYSEIATGDLSWDLGKALAKQ